MALSTTSSDGLGSQENTQAPQSSTAAGAAPSGAAPAGDVQPGTSNSLLSGGPNGIALGNSDLSTVKLGVAAGGQTSAQTGQAPKPIHTVNPLALAFPAGLLLVAVAVFWAISRSAKNTTE